MNIKEIQNSIFQIIIPLDDFSSNFGTCFYIGNGFFMTCMHVVLDESKRIKENGVFRFKNNKFELDENFSNVIKFSYTNLDIVLLSSEKIKNFSIDKNLKEIEFNTKEVEINNDILVVGHPVHDRNSNYDPMVKRGYVSRIDELFSIISFSNLGGFSGSPVFYENKCSFIVHGKEMNKDEELEKFLNDKISSGVKINGIDFADHLRFLSKKIHEIQKKNANLETAICPKIVKMLEIIKNSKNEELNFFIEKYCF